MQIRGQSLVLEAGVCFLLPPGERLVARHDPKQPLTVLAVHLDFTGDPPLEVARRIRVADPHRLRLLAELLADSRAGEGQMMLGLLQLFHLLRHPDEVQGPPLDRRVRRTLERIAANLAHSWTVPELASMAGLSPSRYTALFREGMGQSPRQYVIASRMQRAATLLRETELTQAEIADLLGFNDVYFFNRQFTKFHDQTPGRFRKTAGE